LVSDEQTADTAVTEHKIALSGQLLHRFRLNGVRAQAAHQYDRIVTGTRWMRSLGDRLTRLMNTNASARSKFAQLEQISDEIAAAIAPHAGCKAGCSACCHISVALSDHEARRIGERIGMTPATPPSGQDEADLDRLYFRSPCPFVQDGRCSIYEHRPIACRLHFTLDVDAYFCQTELDPADSAVPNVDLSEFWFAYAFLGIQLGSTVGDIRQFFPSGLKARGTRKENQP